MKRMPAYSKVTRHGQITLPASVGREPGVEEGNLVEIEVNANAPAARQRKVLDVPSNHENGGAGHHSW